MSLLYIAGMILAAAGFCCPIFKSGPFKPNGFDFVGEKLSVMSIGGMLIFAGAVAGIILNFIRTKNGRLFRLIALVASIAGGIILFIYLNDNVIYRTIAKGFIKHAYTGFYMIVAGWILAAAGYITGK